MKYNFCLFVYWALSIVCFAGPKSVFSEVNVQGDSLVMNYDLNVEKNGRYDLSFSILVPDLIDESKQQIFVYLNEIDLVSCIDLKKSGWNNFKFSNVLLDKGHNEMSIISNTNKNIVYSISNVKVDISDGLDNYLVDKKIKYHSYVANDDFNKEENYAYRKGVSYNVPFSYTTLIPLYYKKGDCASFYIPTKNDPKFGLYESNTEFNLYFFHEKPDIFSEVMHSVNKYVLKSFDIEESGLYYLLIEAVGENSNDLERWVSVMINNNMLYKYNYASGTTIEVNTDYSNVFLTTVDSCFNMFTENPHPLHKFSEEEANFNYYR